MKTQSKEWLENRIEEIKARESYTCERTNESIATQYGFTPAEMVKLNFNENLYIPKEKLAAFLKEVAEKSDLRIYPQEEESKLREELAEYLQTSKDSVVIGNGSDELIDRSARFFLQKGDRAVSLVPTFPVFRLCAKYQGAEYTGVPLQKDFSINLKLTLDAFATNTRLLYLCSPNNPTANQFKLDEIEALIEEFPGVVIVDEAYGEYADYSTVPLIDKYANLIVLRTFSKAFGLASLRLGYAVSNAHLAEALGKKPTPYPVSAVSLSMGRKLLENSKIMEEAVTALKNERGKLIKRLNEIEGITAFDSNTNFVLFNTNESYEKTSQSLLKRGIIVKKIGKILQLNNCLRITVGLPPMNTKLLEALEEILMVTKK